MFKDICSLINCFQVSSSFLSDYEYKYFSDEKKLLELIQNGPVVTWIDVTATFLTYAGGPESVWYNPEECVSYEEEEVPQECSRDGGYTCLPREKCTELIPDHCNRYKQL